MLVKGQKLPVKWVASIPSLVRPGLMTDFASRLARLLHLPYYPAIEKTRQNEPQKNMKNSYQQAASLDGVFAIATSIPSSPCLLVDDVATSFWTLTVAAALLRQAGCTGVYPFALAINKSGQS